MMWRKAILVLLLLFSVCSSAGAQRTDVSRLRVDASPVKNLQELVRRCDLIVIGWTDSAHQHFPTRERVTGYGGKTIALEQAGFPDLHKITVSELEQKMKSVTP